MEHKTTSVLVVAVFRPMGLQGLGCYIFRDVGAQSASARTSALAITQFRRSAFVKRVRVYAIIWPYVSKA